jgi:hypothetical protein
MNRRDEKKSRRFYFTNFILLKWNLRDAIAPRFERECVAPAADRVCQDIAAQERNPMTAHCRTVAG